MNNLTFKQYRTVDLITFSAILALSEIIATVATKKWFNLQSIAISTTLLFICIIMMRWSGFAVIPACFGGLVFCIASRANVQQYVIYIVGNCATLISMMWFKVFKKDDGPFSYLPERTSHHSQFVPVAIPYSNEGDVNATVICTTGTVAWLHHALSLTDFMVPIFTHEDYELFLETILKNKDK